MAAQVVDAAAVLSSTLTYPSRQQALPYLMSALSCRWERTQLEPSCGAAEEAEASASTWGGMANIKVSDWTTPHCRVSTLLSRHKAASVHTALEHTASAYSNRSCAAPNNGSV